MSTETLVAFVAALGVGGVGGVFLRAEHESAERRRDHMIAVAEEFLSAVEVAITSIRLVQAQVTRFNFDERDDSRRVAASTAIVDALSRASGELRVAEAVSARFSLISLWVPRAFRKSYRTSTTRHRLTQSSQARNVSSTRSR